MGKDYLKMLAIFAVAVVAGKLLANSVLGISGDGPEVGVQIALGVLIYGALNLWERKSPKK
jgi:hypothetical protein